LAAVVVLLGYAHGWFSFGSNPWAVSKVIGIFILLGYALTAALIVSVAGETGRDALLKSLLLAFLGIALLEYGRYLASGFGFPRLGRVEGFAQDPNAFAFQILIVLSILLSGLIRHRFAIPALMACLAMIWLSGSRSGVIAACVMLPFALYFRPRLTGMILSAAVLAAVALALPVFIEAALSGTAISNSPSTLNVMLEPRNFSFDERWRSLELGFDMFASHPIFGAGLGAFVGQVQRADGSPLIIHSSYLWLLAEFGLVGFAIFVLPLLNIVRHTWRTARCSVTSRIAILVLIGWSTMTLAHDLLYQRLFWFALGAVLALPAAKVLGNRECPPLKVV